MELSNDYIYICKEYKVDDRHLKGMRKIEANDIRVICKEAWNYGSLDTADVTFACVQVKYDNGQVNYVSGYKDGAVDVFVLHNENANWSIIYQPFSGKMYSLSEMPMLEIVTVMPERAMYHIDYGLYPCESSDLYRSIYRISRVFKVRRSFFGKKLYLKAVNDRKIDKSVLNYKLYSLEKAWKKEQYPQSDHWYRAMRLQNYID